MRENDLAYRAFFVASRALLYLAALGGFAIVALVTYSVAMRYVMATPIRYAEEIVGLLTVSIVFLPLPYLALTRKHIAVHTLAQQFPAHIQQLCARLAAALALIFSGSFGYLAFDFARVSYDFNARSPMADLLLYPWMALMPLACLLWGCVSAWQLVVGDKPSTSDDSPRH